MTKTNKILIGAAIGVALLYLWAKNEQEKRAKEHKSNASGKAVGKMRIIDDSKPVMLTKYTPNSWYHDKSGYHWVNNQGHLVS